jgi:ribonuclease P protein component
MPKRQRLSRADFTSLSAAKQRRFFGTCFSLSVASLPGSVAHNVEGPKCACVVSKKVAKSAAERNLIKRRCREALRPASSKLASSLSLIFYAKREARGASYAMLAEDVKRLLAQVK